VPVYALYIPTARRPVSGIGMEMFSSREFAGNILKERNATGRSRTFYVGMDRRTSGADWPKARFPDADETGYMRVFLRYARERAPGLLDRPDEEWIVREGGSRGVVERLPWGDGDERLTLPSDDRLRIAPTPPARVGGEVPFYEVRQPTTVKPEAKMCDGCYMIPSVTGRCGCS
jgi:hypothetical protein